MSGSAVKLSLSEKKRFEEIQTILVDWYKKNRRKFSWRKTVRDPYEVLICEVMGQQTQASRIEEYLQRFLHRFPTVKSLANAPQSEVIKQWQGLGYNRRALNLHRAAKMILEMYPKSFPNTEQSLLNLPGIGKYTAGAILIFSFNRRIATVDVNIQRVLSRLYKKMPDTMTILPTKEIITLANSILPKNNSRLWHEALMDFGATICTKRNPKCSECPLYDNCKSGPVLVKKIPIPKAIRIAKNEPLFFSHPKRIWRGKVLKILSSNETTTLSQIIRKLRSYEDKNEFTIFIKSVLVDLMKEGFCKSIKKGMYSLS